MSSKKKKNKSYDEKVADIFNFNTGGEYEDKKKEKDNTDTETETEQVTEDKSPLLVKKEENCTERFELKLKPSQMKILEKLSNDYNKSKAEITRTAIEFLNNHIVNTTE